MYQNLIFINKSSHEEFVDARGTEVSKKVKTQAVKVPKKTDLDNEKQ